VAAYLCLYRVRLWIVVTTTPEMIPAGIDRDIKLVTHLPVCIVLQPCKSQLIAEACINVAAPLWIVRGVAAV
jgi:hypothetical protein